MKEMNETFNERYIYNHMFVRGRVNIAGSRHNLQMTKYQMRPEFCNWYSYGVQKKGNYRLSPFS